MSPVILDEEETSPAEVGKKGRMKTRDKRQISYVGVSIYCSIYEHMSEYEVFYLT